MEKFEKYKGRKCILRGFHKTGPHYGQAYLERHIGKEFTVGKYFKWCPKQGCFVGDLLIEGSPNLFARVFITWIKES